MVIDVVLTRQRCVFSNTDSIAAQCPNVGVLQHNVPTRFVNTLLLLLVSSHKSHLRSNKVQASPGFNIAYLNILCIPTMVFYVLAIVFLSVIVLTLCRWKASCQGVALPSLLTD